MPTPSRLYRILLHLYPARFREEYAGPMERQFLDDCHDAATRRARARLWLRAFADLAISIPAQRAREFRQDARHAIRAYGQSPLSTGLALVALALAIGVSTGVFSVLNGLLLRSLPFREPERLVWIDDAPVSERSGFRQWRDRNDYLQDAAEYRQNDWNVEVGGESRHAGAAETSANFFSVLGTAPALGRFFSEGEDTPGRDGLAVIGYALWQEAAGGDPRALGSTIRLNGTPLTVIGVAPKGFDYPGKSVVWTPSVHDFDRRKYGFVMIEIAGRLKPGLTLAQAQERYRAELKREEPAVFASRVKQGGLNSIRLVSLRDQLAGPVRQASLALMGMVCFVLFLACANVANLLLCRLTERRRELTIRAALGASRARLAQQVANEAMLLTLAAAAAGLLVAQWTARLAERFQPVSSAAQSYTILDWRVLGFTIGLALLTAVVFGVLPASLLTKLSAGEDVLRSPNAASIPWVGRTRKALLAMQAAFTVALLAGGVTMGHAFLGLLHTDLGFQTEGVVSLRFSLSGSAHDSPAGVSEYCREALDRLRAAPGVVSAGAVDYLPMADYQVWSAMRIRLESGQSAGGLTTYVTPDYFRTMGMRIVEGRDFTAADRWNTDPVIILNQDAARGLGPVVGRKGIGEQDKTYTVIGIAQTAAMFGPSHPRRMPTKQVFLAMDQSRPPGAALVARVRGKPEAYIPMLRDLVQQIDHGVPIFDVKTLDQRLSEELASPRFYTTAVLFFGGFALLLAIVGVYGAASHSVAQRAHEIGVRVAIGATPQEVRLMIMGQSLAPVAIGAAAGAAAALALGRFLSHLIVRAEPPGLWICIAAGVALATTAAGSVWRATRRVAELDPMSILRAE